MKPVVLIGHDVWETFGLARPALEAEGLDLLVHDSRAEAATLPTIDDVSGIVVFGGEMNVDQTDRYPFLANERALIEEAVDRGVPYLGICLGAQMLARAVDTPVFPAAIKEIGFAALHPTEAAADDPLVSVFEDGDMVFHWHEDTFDLPPGAALLATGNEVRVQALRVGDRAWGLQFHFEVDEPELELWLEDAGDALKAAWGKSADEIRAEGRTYLATQVNRAREIFRKFAAEVRAVP